MSRDMDVVGDIGLDDYDRWIRPAFEDAYLVADPAVWSGRAMGSLLHLEEVVKVDLAFGRTDPWAVSAMERRTQIDDPLLGPGWLISPGDLLLAKLEWSDGGKSELQLRDCRSIARLVDGLDLAYLREQATRLGVTDLLEDVLGG